MGPSVSPSLTHNPHSTVGNVMKAHPGHEGGGGAGGEMKKMQPSASSVYGMRSEV